MPAAPDAPGAPAPAARARRGTRAARWLAAGAGALLLLALVAVAAVYALSELRMRARHRVPEHALAVHTDGAAVARGRHVARTRGCTECHGADLAGRTLLDEPAVARLAASNLTRGGRGALLADADWERAVRHGVGIDGRPLIFMPAHEYAGLADDELAAVVAFARSLPSVDRALPAQRVGPVGRALFLAGRLALVPAERVDHARPHPRAVAAAPTAAYGAYLATGCVGCHGETYAGGRIPGAPPAWPAASNLTPAGLGAWTYADFVRAVRGGVRPAGTPVRPPMPLGITRAMTDVELAALWAYLRTLPARPTGAR